MKTGVHYIAPGKFSLNFGNKILPSCREKRGDSNEGKFIKKGSLEDGENAMQVWVTSVLGGLGYSGEGILNY